MIINIITKQNGVGLDKDFMILEGILKGLGHEIQLLNWEQHHYQKADLNIHLEKINDQFIGLAQKNMCIPNPEWFPKEKQKHIPRMDAIFCKTVDSFGIFSRLNRNCVYTSFTSLDRYDPGIPKEREFIHLAGRSAHKNTLPTFRCWVSHPDLKLMHLLKHETFGGYYGRENIQLLINRLEDHDINYLLNRCMFHLCCSEYEGFGHYLHEAKSVGAIVITSDSPPMNEFVKDFGVLIPAKHNGYKDYGRLVKIDPNDLYQKVKKIQELSDTELKRMGEKAREDWKDNDLYFRHVFKESFIKYFG